ncbi:30S ribosomal protein S20 [Ileibacterium valens]|uniref:Small ribosomal subunit protein bS20 n=1 Tax=Ileibacterium valens TaxID=1862668 RepID=A0A1U7NGG5_9FIRM|nr:30S ribosomal protein S20 [Ileibacterium valens]OLU40046.1 30S ribosomal protein S20 [Erysipelotrichaceae bacterium NYU-BL-F16]OLU40115.1 30S ribosomal protein S20 [Erysipelotrichaceae bacterium NYU-BL-E8]OLU40181.1 30S ribosomal protein S20 [Ileibacterium valens]
MPQIKQQKKRVLTNNKAHKRNVSAKSAMKTSIKKVLVAVEANDKEAALAAYKAACSKLDSAVAKGLKHKNYAANQKSRLAKAINAIQ